jgi:CBS domain containing-hemolysin-like protein
MTILIILFFVILILNGLLAASEIAISSFGENKIREMKDEGDNTAGLFEEFLNRQESVYGTIQFMHSLITILWSVVGYLILYNLLSPTLENEFSFLFVTALSVTILTLVFIIFNVLIPKHLLSNIRRLSVKGQLV